MIGESWTAARKGAINSVGIDLPTILFAIGQGLLTAVLLIGCSPGAPAPDDQKPTTASSEAGALENGIETETALDLRVAAFTDLYFLVRAQAAGVVDVDPELNSIVQAWMPVQDHIGTFGGFWPFDLAGMLSTSPAEFADWFQEMDETMPSRAGGEIPIRGPGLAMSEAMQSVWPDFLEHRWPDRQKRLLEVQEQLNQSFMPQHREALRYMLDSLAITDPHLALPTYLALDIHPPGATTYRERSGAVVVLSTNELLGEGRFSDFEETLLHETSHALDLASKNEDDAFTRLRSLLEERGFSRADAAYRDVPHLIMFVQSEETMRRLFNPNHIAYGDTQRGDIAPFYERSGPIADFVRREWASYLDGESSMEQALVRIADEAAKDHSPAQ